MRAHRIAIAIACLAGLTVAAPADAASFRDRLRIDVEFEGRVTERWNRSLTMGVCGQHSEDGGEATVRFSMPRTRMIMSFRDVELRGPAIADLSVDRSAWRRVEYRDRSPLGCEGDITDSSQLDPSACGHRDLKSRVHFDQAGGFRFAFEPGDERGAFNWHCPYPEPTPGFSTADLVGALENGSKVRWIRRQFGTPGNHGQRVVVIRHRKRVAMPYKGEFGETGAYAADIEWIARTRRVVKLPGQRP